MLSSEDGNVRIALPAPVAPRPPHQFPVFATIAPVVVSIAMWLVTGSPFALAFAALGPVVALASIADSRRSNRRHDRVEKERFELEVEQCVAEIERALENERQARMRVHRSGLELLAASPQDPQWLLAEPGGAIEVVLGRAQGPSGIRVHPEPSRGEAPELASLRELASRVDDVPLVADARDGIAIVGPEQIAVPVERALLIQSFARLAPADAHVQVAQTAEAWLDELPHRIERTGEKGVTRIANEHATVTVLRADSEHEVPSHIRTIIGLGAEGPSARPGRGAGSVRIRPEYATELDATSFARRLAARADGVKYSGIPEAAEFAELDAVRPDGEGLACPIGLGEDGPIVVDLVRHGPHAVVAGTTGSGKSELLITWVLGMARLHPPDRLNVLLVDFKGGAAFDGLSGLPHCVGTISDLDEAAAARVLESLGAELTARERRLVEAGARSVDESGSPLARLVVVVDEFAAMLDRFPQMHDVFADIAARGRSLGVHLILCTQRPVGVLRESLLANADLRMSLRVNSEADSRALIGVPDAARLIEKGRALVCLAGEPVRHVQIALARREDVARVASAHPAERVLPPWLPPLPAHLALDALPADGGIRIGLADIPAQQRQPPAVWEPARHGHLLVVGGSGSGKTETINTIETEARANGLDVLRAGADMPLLWDALADATARLDQAAGRCVLLLDDADLALETADDEYERELIDRLVRIARAGPGRGIHLAVTLARLTGRFRDFAALCGSRLVLRLPTRDEHLVATGDPDVPFETVLTAGRGRLNGVRVQVALAQRDESQGPFAVNPQWTNRERFVEVDPASSQTMLAVSGRPEEFARRLRDLGAEVIELEGADPQELAIAQRREPVVLLGDPDAWQSRWGALTALRRRTAMLFDDCSLAELRLLIRNRALPPPCAGRPMWLVRPDGELVRARLVQPRVEEGCWNGGAGASASAREVA